MIRKLKEKIEALPDDLGVYLIKDDTGQVVYVGKARHLKRRFLSYFKDDGEPIPVPFLQETVSDIEAIVVENEKEALRLENELIKLHKPRFNIILEKDDNFVYLRLDSTEPHPYLEVVTRVKRDGARYFGPYPATHALRETLRGINRHFHIRIRSDHDAGRHEEPCMLYRIGSFPEPAVHDMPPEQSRRRVEDAVRFLEGRKPELLESLRRQMKTAVSVLNFEEAARLRDKIRAVQRTLRPPKSIVADVMDQDIIGFYREENQYSVYVLFIRQRRIIGGRSFIFVKPDFPFRERLESFINLYYNGDQFVPDRIVLPLELEGIKALEEMLTDKKGSSVRLSFGEGKSDSSLVRMSNRNAAQAAVKPLTAKDESQRLLERLQRSLHLNRVPHRIECFDVSHFHGEMTVASKVAMTEGEIDKSRYRRYRIRSVDIGDDYTAMLEVVSRRLKQALEQNDLPDLIVLDGGKPQLSAGLAAMNTLGLTEVGLAALAKKKEWGGKNGEESMAAFERIFIPGRPDAILLPQTSPELLLLVRLRDEAHRVAISYQKILARNERLRSELEEIPFIGDQRKNMLLSRFGSIDGIVNASLEELSHTNGIGLIMSKKIYDYFRNKKIG